jgi:BirA family biotin operon repressor/biotin-[acetyl-CoA-carboxylase] ligase
MFPASEKRLLRALADGRPHTRRDLAASADISPAAVGALVREFTRKGLEIRAGIDGACRLSRPVEWLDERRIGESLAPPACDLMARLEIHDELDSTNTHLLRAASEGAPSGTVCLAESQRTGKGRGGRVWVSPFGSNIYLSILWHFDRQEAMEGLSLAAGVAVVRALRRAQITELNLKWPNDILWRERKLGGILIEASGEAGGRHVVVVGVGLNTYVPPVLGRGIDQAWVDIEHIRGGRDFSRNGLAGRLLNELLPMLRTYQAAGLAPYLPEWRRLHGFEGRQVTLHLADRQIEGKVTGLTDQGWLILESGHGRQQCFASGDVRLRANSE